MARDRTIDLGVLDPAERRRAPVSAPLAGTELDDVRPDDFDVLTHAGPVRRARRPARRPGRRPAYSLEPLLELADRDGLEAPPER